jgi:hypothetical protein
VVLWRDKGDGGKAQVELRRNPIARQANTVERLEVEPRPHWHSVQPGVG